MSDENLEQNIVEPFFINKLRALSKSSPFLLQHPTTPLHFIQPQTNSPSITPPDIQSTRTINYILRYSANMSSGKDNTMDREQRLAYEWLATASSKEFTRTHQSTSKDTQNGAGGSKSGGGQSKEGSSSNKPPSGKK